MLQIGMIVKILPDAEYSGKFTGYIGKVKNYFSQNKKVGVELFQQTNDASSKGLTPPLALQITSAVPVRPAFRRSRRSFIAAPRQSFCGPTTPKPLFPVGKRIPMTTIPVSVPLWSRNCSVPLPTPKRFWVIPFKSMINLFQHQQQALDETEGKNRVAYYLDMGLGKTFVGSEKMMKLNKRINLVVCQCSKVQDWIEHFQAHYTRNCVFDLTNPKTLNRFSMRFQP